MDECLLPKVGPWCCSSSSHPLEGTIVKTRLTRDQARCGPSAYHTAAVVLVTSRPVNRSTLRGLQKIIFGSDHR